MEDTDLGILYDEGIDHEQYKKWTAVKLKYKKKQGMHKNPDLVRKERKKKNTIKRRDREFLDELYILPITTRTVQDKQVTFLHPESIKSIPSYESPPKLSWWSWLIGKRTMENYVEADEQIIKHVLREIK